MKLNFFIMAAIVGLCSCDSNSPNDRTRKDTITPQNVTTPTPDNPGGLQPNGGTTPNGTNATGGDTANGMNGRSRDSMR